MDSLQEYKKQNSVQPILLGAVGLQPQYFPNVSSELEIKHFSTELQPLYACYLGYWQSGKNDFDVIRLKEQHPEVADVLIQCTLAASDYVIDESRVIGWVEQVKNSYTARQMQSLALQMAEVGENLESITSVFERMEDTMTSGADNNDTVDFSDSVDDYIRHLEDKPVRIRTGIESLDRDLFISPGNFVIIGGRPSAGKTAFSLQMAANMARDGKRVLYFSYETDCGTLRNRLMANLLNVDLGLIKSKQAKVSDLDRIANMKKMPLKLCQAAGRNTAWIKAKTMQCEAEVIFIDYLQLIPSSGNKSRYEAVTEISMQLHTMAQTMGVTIVALAQLNRNAAQGGQPTNADLRESGQIEQDADAIILLSGDGSEYYAGLTKNKEGGTGELNLDFDKAKQKFYRKPY